MAGWRSKHAGKRACGQAGSKALRTRVLWAHMPVRMVAREGQHSGKLTTACVKLMLRQGAGLGMCVW